MIKRIKAKFILIALTCTISLGLMACDLFDQYRVFKNCVMSINSDYPLQKAKGANCLLALASKQNPNEFSGRQVGIAIPYLIRILYDHTQLEWRGYGEPVGSGTLTSPSDEAVRALTKITGVDFSSNPIEWLKWWNENKISFFNDENRTIKEWLHKRYPLDSPSDLIMFGE